MTTPNYRNDQDNITRHMRGDMTVDEQITIEVPMSGEDELAAAVTAAIAIDDLRHHAVEQDRHGRS